VTSPAFGRHLAADAGLMAAAAAIGYGLLAATTVRLPAAAAAGSANSVPGSPADGAVGWLDESWRALAMTSYPMATAVSVLASAVAVAMVGTAARLSGSGRSDAWSAAGLVATCPAVVFFAAAPGATAVALMLGALALACLGRWMQVQGTAAGIAAGAFAALATVAAPGSGLALPAVAIAAIELRRDPPIPARWLTLGRGLMASSVVAVVLMACLSSSARQALASAWLRACFPMAWVGLVLWSRPAAALMTAALLPGLGMTMGSSSGDAREGGSLLVLVLPLAFACAHALPRRLLLPLLVLGAAVGSVRVYAHDQRARVEELGGSVRQAIARPAQVRLIVRDVRESAALRLACADIECVTVGALVESFEALADREFYTEPIEAVFDRALLGLLGQGHEVYLTHGAEDLLRDLPFRVRHHVAVRLFDRMRKTFQLVQVDAPSFRAKRLERKPG